MIELNCSYEESKKIFELGYDFSKVCWKSLYECRYQYNLNKTFIKIHVHGTGLSLTLIEDQIKHQMGKYGIVGSFAPIIPKAALEACLPDLSGSTWLINNLRTWMILDLDPHIIKLESIFEAFTWCHKNYPEKLRKKFEEVMR